MGGEPFGNYQFEIYLSGLGGTRPTFPLTAAGMESRARESLGPETYDYIAGGASTEDTMRANLAAFRKWAIVPRILRDVSTRNLEVEVLGTRLAAPVLLAPIGGVQARTHPDAELAVARAAAGLGIGMVLSTAASTAMEEVATANGDGARWYQLYWPRDPALTRSFLRRAEASGYSAIVVTLDTQLLAWRPRDLSEAFLPFLRGEGVANYFSDPVFRAGLSRPPEEDLQAAVMHWVSIFSDSSMTWDNLSMIRETTRLPILLKGVLHPDDATRAARVGVDGIIVSNHGGRQVDGAIGALDALEGVVAAVPDGFPVLFDSGIRSGADIFKALALGARAVLIGRPYMWGLAIGGEQGVSHALRCLLADLDLTMALSGCPSIREIARDSIVPGPLS
ncbi:MAG: lactate 2-monooxygenase [Candidatus Dormibacteria bacterium]